MPHGRRKASLDDDGGPRGPLASTDAKVKVLPIHGQLYRWVVL